MLLFCTYHNISTLDIREHVGFEVLTAVVMKSIIFWDIMPCSSLSVNRRFGGICRLHLQDGKNNVGWQSTDYTAFLAQLNFRPWRWRRYVPPKRRSILEDYMALYPRRWYSSCGNMYNILHQFVQMKTSISPLSVRATLSLRSREDVILITRCILRFR
jgi:hypothetical protein